MNYAFYISGKSRRLAQFFEQATKQQLNDIKIVISDEPIENTTKFSFTKSCSSVYCF